MSSVLVIVDAAKGAAITWDSQKIGSITDLVSSVDTVVVVRNQDADSNAAIDQFADLIVDKQDGVSAFDDQVMIISDKSGDHTGQSVNLADHLWNTRWNPDTVYIAGVTGVETVETAEHALFAGFKTRLVRNSVWGEDQANVDWHADQFSGHEMAMIV